MAENDPPEKTKQVLRETDADAIRLAKTLIRSARYGALATIDAVDGAPLASRVAMATDMDGTPLILISSLSAHTAALDADPRCSLLVGEPGKGDPLAYPRISVSCRAERLESDTEIRDHVERRYLNRHPKAKLYAGFGDFAFFRLEMTEASLNGGFARAYHLERQNLLTDLTVVTELLPIEQGAIDHMNADHADAVEAYTRHYAKGSKGKWRLTGIDPDGIDLMLGDKTARAFFPGPLDDASQLRPLLVEMAKNARAAIG